MKKYLFILVILLTFIPLISLKSSADAPRVYDELGIGVADAQMLELKLRDAENKTGISFFALIHKGRYSESRMLSRMNKTGSEDMVILLIERIYGTYYFELFTYGTSYNLISDDDADYILDSLTPSIKSGDVVTGVASLADITVPLILENRESARFSVIITSLIIAIACGATAVGIVVYRYKRKLKAPIYPLSKYANLTLNYSSDDFITSHVTRVRINTGSSGSGRSRGGSRGRR